MTSPAPSLSPGSEAATGRADVRPLDAVARVAPDLLSGRSLDETLEALVHAAASLTGAQVAVVRVATPDGTLVARAVHARSGAVAAELEGSKLRASELGAEDAQFDLATNGSAPAGVRRVAARADAASAAVFPVGGEPPEGTLEVYRGYPFTEPELALARLAAAHLGIALDLSRALAGTDGASGRGEALPRARR